MFAIVIVGHGEFSTGLKNAAEMILGEQENMVAVPLLPTDSPESYLEKLKEATEPYDDLVILADLKGGTPANLANYIVREKNCKCIAGINLPTLLEIMGSRLTGMDIDKAVSVALEAGREGIFQIN